MGSFLSLSLPHCVCVYEAQRANKGGVDSLTPPPRKKVQGQIAHSLYQSF